MGTSHVRVCGSLTRRGRVYTRTARRAVAVRSHRAADLAHAVARIHFAGIVTFVPVIVKRGSSAVKILIVVAFVTVVEIQVVMILCHGLSCHRSSLMSIRGVRKRFPSWRKHQSQFRMASEDLLRCMSTNRCTQGCFADTPGLGC